MPKKVLKGKIVSDKMNKTVLVEIENRKQHKLYHKLIKVTKKFSARNDIEVALGDEVLIEETVPYSKKVTWKVVENLNRGN